MSNLISRQSAIDAITDENIIRNMDSVMDSEMHRVKRSVHRIIASMSSAQPESKHGKWIENNGLYQCSVCKHIFSELWWTSVCPIDRMNKIMHYCPNCGTRMSEQEQERTT